MSGPEESLRQYREALHARPELKPRPLPNPADETTLAASSTGGTAAQNAFPANYEVVEKIAETQLSRTWKAFDVERQTYVVIKEPRERLLLDADALDRFRREVQLVSKLSHANIVPILATHLSEPPYFYTMPLIEGEHLDHFCRQQRLETSERLDLFLKVCRAVIHAHQHGVIHRDLKPNNVLVDEDGEPQLLDFGLGRTVDPGSTEDDARTESVMGAPGYMAPEQAAGLSGDVRTDVYSLGVVLFQILTGQLPIVPTRDLSEMLRRIQEHPPLAPITIRPDIGIDLNAIILKGLAKAPADRYQSVNDLACDVENALSHRPVSARPQAAGYVARKWVRRNWWQVLVGCGIAVGIIMFTVFAINMRLSAAHNEMLAREAERHPMAVFKGRVKVGREAPLEAAAILWAEHLDYDNTRTRYALWEFYRRYPCLYHIGNLGRQVMVAYSPDGAWLASVAGDERLIIYRAATGRVSDVVPAERVRATSIAFSPQPGELFVGGSDGRVRRLPFASETGTIGDDPAALVEMSTEPVTSVALSAHGGWLAAGDRGGTVCVWNTTKSDYSAPNARWPNNGIVRDLAFSANGSLIACASYSSTAGGDLRPGGWWIRDLRSGELLGGEPKSCRVIRFSEDGRRVFTGADQLETWEGFDEPAATFEAPSQWGIRSLAISNGVASRYLAIAYGDGTIRFYDRDLDTWCRIQGYHESGVAEHIDVCFSPGGEQVASVGRDGLRVWDFFPARQIELTSSKLINATAESLAISPDTSSIWVVLGGDLSVPQASNDVGEDRHTEQLVLYSRSSDTIAEPELYSDRASLNRPAVTRDGRLVAFRQRPMNAESSQLVVAKTSDPDVVYAHASIEALPANGALCWAGLDQRWLLAGYRDGTLWAWRRAETGNAMVGDPECIHRFADECTHITTSRDDCWIAACSEAPAGRAGEVTIWHATAGHSAGREFDKDYESVNEFSADGDIWRVAFQRDTDGTLMVATAGSPRDVHLWDALTGEPRGTLRGHRDAVDQCEALDDHLIVTASRDRTVRIWDTWEREEVCLLYESETHTPKIAVCNGQIVIADNMTLTIADTRENQRFIDGNVEFERHVSLDSSPGQFTSVGCRRAVAIAPDGVRIPRSPLAP